MYDNTLNNFGEPVKRKKSDVQKVVDYYIYVKKSKELEFFTKEIELDVYKKHQATAKRLLKNYKLEIIYACIDDTAKLPEGYKWHLGTVERRIVDFMTKVSKTSNLLDLYYEDK